MKYELTIKKGATFDEGSIIGNIFNTVSCKTYKVYQNEDKGLYFEGQDQKYYLNNMMSEPDFNKVQDAILKFLFSKEDNNKDTLVEIEL
ncbi:MAG: hypothetical protein E6346_10750 [Lactococcus lactis]|jgi:hypothetical protein|nr:hypothetical protein [Lactococcus lactis]